MTAGQWRGRELGSNLLAIRNCLAASGRNLCRPVSFSTDSQRRRTGRPQLWEPAPISPTAITGNLETAITEQQSVSGPGRGACNQRGRSALGEWKMAT